MATVSYTIRSHYEPQEHKQPTRDTSPSPDDGDPSEYWEFDRAFKPSLPPPPRFVPATLPPPDLDSGNAHASSSSSSLLDASPAVDLSTWYRSLTSKSHRSETPHKPLPRPRSPRRDSVSTTPLPSDSRPVEKKNKNNWFIMNAIRSDSTTQPVRISSPTLADIIARDPPPLPAEQRFEPPVWLEIGPSNKGFAMLQRSGWSEGEPLGPDVVRRRNVTPLEDDMIPLKKKMETLVKQETLEVTVADHEDVAELRQVDVIDLTLSDEDEDHSRGSPAKVKTKLEPSATAPAYQSRDPHGRTALLTPIATVLKSDRLGIGLKAKTVGPYKASQKRITHNAAAISAHMRAAEESRRRKQQHGRGWRGFALQRKKEEADRKGLLADLKL